MLNITILIDCSFTTSVRRDTTKNLYQFLIQVVTHLQTNNKKILYRFGGFGSVACCLTPTSAGPFPYFLYTMVDTPHQEMTEQSKLCLLDTLQGQPFPQLGVNNIRSVLMIATNGKHAAHHVVVIAAWPPGESTADTWKVMQTTGSVTFVNLEEPTNRLLPHLKSVWWVDGRSPKRLANKLDHATPSEIKVKAIQPIKKEGVAKMKQVEPLIPFVPLKPLKPLTLTTYEKLHVTVLDSLNYL